MKKVLIIGCGLLGSSLLKNLKKKIAKKYLFMKIKIKYFENKSRVPGTIVKK